LNKRLKEIEQEIESLKNSMSLVEGSETEVYSRIVGYYRSVRNWNHGKKEEYKVRVPFSTITGREIAAPADRSAEAGEAGGHAAADSQTPGSYTFFFRTTCPNCPPMKEALGEMNLEGRAMNVDTEEGLEEASRYNIFSAPTVVFFNNEGEEIFRTGNHQEVRSQFSRTAATA